MSMRKYGASSFKRPMTEEKEMNNTKEVKRYKVSSGGFLIEDSNGMVVTHEDYAALKSERDALATENLAIQDFDVIEFMESGPYQPNDPTLQSLKTPVTNAYANQLRAEGVEIFAAQKMAEAEKYDSNLSREISMAAKVFAANLRKENGND